MADLERALALAATSHRGQKDRGGLPYILHPLRLMHQVATIDEKIAALLHDVVEDTPVTLDDLQKEGFSAEIIAAVDCLTHRQEESYDAYLIRLGVNRLARTVKFADLRDNMNILRLPHITDKDLRRLARYHKAFRYLESLESQGADE